MVDLKINLPESFLQEEERDGYKVSAEMKQLWAVQMDLLCELDRVCKKHNLRYTLDFGTLLGAIRHKGFIPWDEDIDVTMLREDFNKLQEIAASEFQHPYFFQTVDTDPGFDGGIARIRRSDTTFLQKEGVVYRTKHNHGIFIDIFVFDNAPSNDYAEVRKIHLDCNRIYFRGIYILAHPLALRFGKTLPKRLARYLYAKLKYGSVTKAYKLIEDRATHFPESGYVCCLDTPIDTWIRPKKWFEEITHVPFEGMMFPVSAHYDEILTQRYGDYMTPVVVDSIYKMWMFDADRPYNEVINEKGFYDNQLKELGLDVNGNKVI